MTEERAALLITEYANGLRRELNLLGASEVNDLVSEIASMLRDASEGDEEIAAAEIERLGAPERMARTVLEQHGLESGPGLQTASWWRLGVAAPIDIAVGLAAPAAASALVWRASTSLTVSGSGASPFPTGVPMLLIACALLVGALWVAWRYWRPWRVGGGEATAGMALAGIAIITLGGARTVVPTADLVAAGLAHPNRSRIGSALTVAMATLVLVWAIVAVVSPTGAGNGGVEQFAGDQAAQENGVRAAVAQAYRDALDASPTSASDSRQGAVTVAAALRKRAVSGALASYRIVSTSDPVPGEWIVDVVEVGVGGTRAVTVMVDLRVTWTAGGTTTPEWIVSGYDSAGAP